MEGNEMSLAYENVVFHRRSGLSGGRMACTLITGFLGSGKTTLMKHILDNRGDLRIAVLVNEFADSDVDSLLLNSTNLNAAFNLPTVSLTHGCDCCNVSGPFRESLQQVVNSKHNFDCLLVETSGLAKPDKFVAELEEVGIHLDITIAVVDAESLHNILSMDIVKQQLQHVDLVLLNKCDLATLGQISDAEDTLEALTGGAKVVRSQFCKVPLDLVIDLSTADPQPMVKEDASAPPFLSHETLPQMTFRANILGNTSVSISASAVASEELTLKTNWKLNDSENVSSHAGSFSSFTFESEDPLLMSLFQSRVLTKLRNSNNLLRAKGILWFEEDRESRFVFQWSGVKRVEAICGELWENAPKSCLVLIGTDKSELENIVMQLSQSTISKIRIAPYIAGSREFATSFSARVHLDGRFKEPVLDKEPLVIFGLKGSPLHGIKESQLNGPLMHLVNGKGRIFLSATVSGQGEPLIGMRMFPDLYISARSTICSSYLMKAAAQMKHGMKSEWLLLQLFLKFAKISAHAESESIENLGAIEGKLVLLHKEYSRLLQRFDEGSGTQELIQTAVDTLEGFMTKSECFWPKAIVLLWSTKEIIK